MATEIERLDEEQRSMLGSPIGPAYGPRPLHEVSHGESFLALVMNRFGPGGLYFLDEPEAALSPTGCFALVRRFHELADAGSQFIIATHSPIVMSFPGALIYLLTDSGPKETPWDDLDHVLIIREFLNDPAIVLRDLLAEPWLFPGFPRQAARPHGVPSSRMATEPPNVPTPPAEPPKAPGPGASRDEWRAWNRAQRDYMRQNWGGGWYGPWPWGGGGVWSWFWGAALVLIGGYYLLQNLGLLSWLKGDVLWPSLLIVLGIFLLLRRGRFW